MITYWFIGTNEPPGTEQTAQPGYVFIDPSNGGLQDGGPQNPWISIQAAVDNTANGTQNGTQEYNIPTFDLKFVVASGIHVLPAIVLGSRINFEMIANTKKSVEIQIDGAGGRMFSAIGQYVFNGIIFAEGLIGASQTDGGFYYIDCETKNEPVISGIGATDMVFVRHIFDTVGLELNQTSAGGRGVECHECSFINGAGINTNAGRQGVINLNYCDISPSSEIRFRDANVADVSLDNCNLQGTLSNQDGGSTAVTITNPIGPVAPGYLGDFSLREYLIPTNSPLLFASTDGYVGALKPGFINDLTGGTSNGVAVGPPLELITALGSNNQGTYTPLETTLASPEMSPFLRVNGVVGPTYVDDIVVTNLQFTKPGKRDVEVQYRETVGGPILTNRFLYNCRMWVDNNGRGTGEPDFRSDHISSTGDIVGNPDLVVPGTNTITVAEYQPIYAVSNLPQALRFTGGNNNQEYIDCSGFNLTLGDGTASNNNFTSIFLYRKNGNNGTDNFDFLFGRRVAAIEDCFEAAQNGVSNQEEPRAILRRDGRSLLVSASDTHNVAPYTNSKAAFGVNVSHGFSRIGNAGLDQLFWDAVGSWPLDGSQTIGNLLTTDVIFFANFRYASGVNISQITFSEIDIRQHIICQPALTPLQVAWLNNADSNNNPLGRTWGEMQSSIAKSQGIGIDGVDTIGVGGITTLCKLYVDFTDLNEDGGNYYIIERVTNNTQMGILVNFVGDPNDSLVIW